MSTTLGIAAVTSVLQSILSNRMAAVASVVGGSIAVSTVAPDRVDLSGSNDPNQVNIFLHRAVPNPGWANCDLPARDARARRIAATPLVLDLHYLISVYAASAFAPEILVGEIMQEFHERPVPTRAVITSALNPASPPAGFPTELAQSGLAEQVENIRITAEAVSNEEMSKLWTALQARYRMSLVYQVTTVIIDTAAPARQALPVRRRLGNALTTSFPVLEQIAPQDDPLAPIVAGTALRIRGSELGADGLRLLLGDTDLSAAISARDDKHIDFTLPDPLPAGVHAGGVAVQVVRQTSISDPPEDRDVVASNPLIMMLRPQFSVTVAITDSTVVDGTTLQSGTLDLVLAPPVRRAQRVSVALNGTADPWRAYSFRAPDGNGFADGVSQGGAVSVPFSRVAAGDYLLRVQVDAAQSALTVDGNGVYDGPLVSL